MTESPTKTISKSLTYVVQTTAIDLGGKKLIKKDLEYAIIVSFIDFDPDQFGPRTVFVNDKVAIKLKGRIYVEV